MKKLLLGLLIVTCGSSMINAQGVINLHSITDGRQPGGDGGYTLDGGQMVDARQKLLNANNFGPTGTFPKSIVITDGYQTSGSLGAITANTGIDMFYFGIFDVSNPTLVTFTASELDSLYEWSVRGGKLIIGSGAPIPSYPFLPTVLNSRWGFDLALFYPTPIVPTAPGLSSTLFNGPFGSLSVANQGGGSQGYFNNVPADVVVLADDGSGNPTMYLDCATLDLVVADGDAYTSLGDITFGNGINSSNDQLWANTIAYMDALEGPPVIMQNGNQLSTGTYSAYQWFLDGNLIPGATTNTLTMTQPGTYNVSVLLSCGCNSMATQSVMFVGMDELTNQPMIHISPNPVGNQGIKFNGVTKQTIVNLYTIDGKMADEFMVSDQNQYYATEQLAKGLYFVKMHDVNGNFISAQKFIKN